MESQTTAEPRQTGLAAFLKEIYGIWISERPTQYAAALAYYSIFSFVPVIYIGLTITDRFVQRLAVSESFYQQITNLLGAEMTLAVQEAVANLGAKTTSGSALMSLIGFVALAFSASLMFFQLQHTLNTLWKVPPPKRGQTGAYLRGRLLAFAMVLGVVVLLIASAMANVVISFVNSVLNWGNTVAVANTVTLLVLVALSFALLYKILPNARVAWRDVWVGAGPAALLVTAGVVLIKLFLGAGSFNSALAAAGAVAVLLMGFYYLGQIFVLGALITRVYAGMYGTGIVPHAEKKAARKGSGEETASSGGY